MNFWRLLIVFLILLGIGLLIASAWLGWDPYGSPTRFHWEVDRRPPFMAEVLDQPLPAFISALSALFTQFLSGVLLFYLFPRRVRNLAKVFTRQPGALLRLALAGLLSGVLIVALTVSSALTVGTIPIGIALGMVLFLSGFGGFLVLAYTLAHGLFRHAGWSHTSPLIALFAGLLILFPWTRPPYLGLALQILFASLGIGVVIVTRFGSGKPWDLGALMED